MTLHTRRRHRRGGLGAALAVLAGLLVVPTAGAAPLPYETALRVDAGSPRAAAIQISQSLFADGRAGAVVLARGDTFPDALGASALTTEVDGPLLLTPPDRLADDTRNEIARALPDGGTVYLLGGTTALTRGVERELDDLGYRTPRFPGRDRVETAAMIARFLGVGPRPQVLLVRASGDPDLEQGWVDSVSCGGYAAEAGIPILLTHTHSATVARQSLRTMEGLGVSRVHVCGGPLAVPEAQLDQLRAAGYDVQRHAGENRAATAVAVAEGLWNVPSRDGRTFLLVPGYGTRFGFGLVAAPLAAALDAPILLVDRTRPTDCGGARAGATLCFLEAGSSGAEALVAVGGTGVITDDVLVAAAAAADLPRDDEPPPVPSAVEARDRPEDDGTAIAVAWQGATGESGPVTYTLYVRRSDADGSLTRANSTTIETAETSHLLTDLEPGVAYDVAVDARDQFDNRSNLSGVVTATPTDEVPAGPGDQGPSVAARAAGGLDISWSTAPEADVAAYELQRRPASGPLLGSPDCEEGGLLAQDFATIATVEAPTTSYVDDVDETDPWCYRYRVVDTTGNTSPFSAVTLWAGS